MSLITKLNRLTVLRSILASTRTPVRCISTSPKKSDTATVSTTEKVEGTEQFSAKTKNWVYWGFDTQDRTRDDNAMRASFFFSVTLCLVWGSFVYFYKPDPLLRDWSQREAYLELRRREAAGLEPIDANYIDPAKIVLPSDEELGETEIII
jgi:NADH dehydrogenase (ubiquinone) 1 beta subcomplex subunit 11